MLTVKPVVESTKVSNTTLGFISLLVLGASAFFGLGGGRITRFIFENGAFYPVWYKDTFNLQVNKSAQ